MVDLCDDVVFAESIDGGLLAVPALDEYVAVFGRFWTWDPKETASLITWAIYLLLVNYRLSAGWRGRRAAYISIVGFVSALFTFGATSWFKGWHTYL